MSEFVRSWLARAREFIGNRRRPPRRAVRLRVVVRLISSATGAGGEQVLHGHTQDVSSQGVSFVVSAIRIGTDYLIGDDRTLHLTLELPDAPVEIQAVAVRYHQLDAGVATGKNFLVGARITGMSVEAKRSLDEYLKPRVG